MWILRLIKGREESLSQGGEDQGQKNQRGHVGDVRISWLVSHPLTD